MVEHEFGGPWTTDKLERLRKYLCAYMTIFKKNLKAQYFTTIYVDAFAGTGHRVSSPVRGTKASPLVEAADPEAESFKKGSARIAMEVSPPFDQFIFIESDSERVKELETLRGQFPDKAQRVQVKQGNANEFLKQWCQETEWKRHRAVVFLDPYGMQVDWKTLESLAATKAVDLWLLFPLGVAVNRLLTKSGPPPHEWAEALTRIFGTDEWKDLFYPKKQTETLWGPKETRQKEATLETIGRFFRDRLKTIFPGVADNPLPLQNSKGVPIYLLCFAAGNPRGAPTAVKIAQNILKP